MKIKKFKKKFIIISVFLLISNLFLDISIIESKAYNNIKFKNITIEDGLSQATVEAIFQDSRGYIWMGTNDGLSRYNGYEFKVYRNDIGIENGIVNNYILSINEDKEGNLWVGTIDGVSKINLTTYEIKNYNLKDGLANGNVEDILVTANSEILFATLEGLAIYNKEYDNFEMIFTGDCLVNQEIFSLDEDDKGNVWVGSSKGVTKINLSDGTYTKYETSKNPYNIDDSIHEILYDDGCLWIGTLNSGLFRLDIENNHTEKIELNNKEEAINFARSLLKSEDGKLWIGTNAGVVKYDIETKSQRVYCNDVYDKNSLVNNKVYCLMQDKSGLIWVGTILGVSMFEPETKIEHYKSAPNNNISLNENIIHGIYQDDEGLIWVGTNNSGVNIIDRENNKIYDFPDICNNSGLSSNGINQISGHKNLIFISTNNGLNVYDKTTGLVKVYNEEDGLNAKRIRNTMYDKDGILWVGSNKGFNILNLNTGEIMDLNPILDKHNITDKHAGYIFKDSYGIYWLGAFLSGGLIKIDPYNNTIKNYISDENSNSISNNAVRNIIEDSNGDIWIGTSGGLNKLDRETEEFVSYTTLDGLPNNTIYGIVIDDNGNLWMSTNGGLSKFDPVNKTFQNLDVTDGLQSNEFNGHSYAKLKNGDLIFGGINGLNIFNPDKIMSSDYMPSVEFSTFKVNGKDINQIDNAKLNHHENTIYIKFFFPDYKNINNISYYYLLEDSTDEWLPLDGNSIMLSNLKYGTYVFKVKARNSFGVYSEVKSLKFTIKVPFWRSTPTVILNTIIIAAIITYKFRSKDKKMKLLDELVKKRTLELSEEMDKSEKLFNKVITLEKTKNSYLVNLSHDIKTPINVLSSIQQVVSNMNNSDEGISKEKLDHYMSMQGRNINRLLKLINDLINISKIEDGNYNINISSCDIVYLVEETALSLKDYVESNDLELIIDPEIEECIIECDTSEIERCVENLINNAVKFTNKGGKILVSIIEDNDEVKISVNDTGIGIEEKYLSSIFDRFGQVKNEDQKEKGGSGLGLTITKLIVELHNGSISVESRVHKGSRFTITLPKKQPQDKKV